MDIEKKVNNFVFFKTFDLKKPSKINTLTILAIVV